MADSESISSLKKSQGDFLSIMADAITNVQYKLFILMFLTFIGLSTDVFIDRVLARLSGAVEGHTPTAGGTVVQGILLVIACIIFDFLIRMEII